MTRKRSDMSRPRPKPRPLLDLLLLLLAGVIGLAVLLAVASVVLPMLPGY